jgi:tape measure domain-containing protein
MSSTFSSITKAMHSTLNAMKSIDTGTNSISSSFSKAKSDILNAEKQLRSYQTELNNTQTKTQQATNSNNSFLKSLMQFDIIKKGLSMITGQLDSAINRFDTINNYQNVMAGLGFDNAQSQASIERLKQGLDGLPATLDEAVMSVQRFASVNENLEASTEIALALNDALAAGGAPAMNQAAALEQISQAYSKGKFDAMEYRAMMSAMPAQLKQVAKHLGYTSTAIGGDLYTALQKGTLGMNEFMKAIVELDREGIDGMSNFHDQALNATSGIATAIRNMKTAITKGITDSIESINNALSKAGLPTIQQIITNIGKTLQRMVSTIGSMIGQIITFLQPVFSLVNSIITFVQSNWTIIEPILQAIIIVLGTYYSYTLLASAATNILTAAFTLLTSPVFWILAAITAIIAVLIYLWNTNDEVAYGMIWAWDALTTTGMILKYTLEMAFYAIVIAALYMYEGFLGVKLGMQTAFYGLIAGAQSMQLGFQGAMQGIVNAGVWMYNKIVELLNKLGANMSSMSFADFTSNTVDALSKTMGEYAKAKAETLGQMSDIGNSIGEFQAKLGTLSTEANTNINNKIATDEATRSDRVANRKQLSLGGGGASNIGGATLGAIGDIGDMMGDVLGSDGAGGKALKTTSNDKLLTDEDIQLLLDVATRDYKLNYQQITPDITVTFGDVRETADVDLITDRIADKLQEIYDANLEVG